ncbi:MAG: molybdopterin-binding protein, partial [Rhodospirillales bacterium]|nr:molybdopterin-binding protein [Rhodospirillales bacterium]
MSRDLARRAMLGRALAFGALGALTGCDYDHPHHPDLADEVLRGFSAWNDTVQAALFDPRTLAPTFRADQITRPPRFNAFYGIEDVHVVDGASWKLDL